MVVLTLLSTIRFFFGLVACFAMSTWLSYASGISDPVITPTIIGVLVVLGMLDLLCQLPSRVYQRSIPGIVVVGFCVAGYLAGDDSYLVVGSLIAIGTCLLSIFTWMLDRVRRGGPFLV